MSYKPVGNTDTTHSESPINIEMPIQPEIPDGPDATKESQPAQEYSDASSTSQKRPSGTDAKTFSVNTPRMIGDHGNLTSTLKPKKAVNFIITMGMIALSVPFFVYAGIAWSIHGREVDRSRWAIYQQMGSKVSNSINQ